MKLMTKNTAMDLLGIGRKRLENMLKAGQLKCVPCGNSVLIPDWSIEQCQKNIITYPSSSSCEGKYTTSIYQPSLTDNEYSFEKARIQATEKKLKNTHLNDLLKLSNKPNIEPTQIN